MATVEISESAMRRLGSILGPTTESARNLRIFVDHRCHCGGLKFGMEFSLPLEGDRPQETSGVTVLVAPEVADAPGTAEVDFSQSPFMSNFTLRNSEHYCEWRSS